MAYFICKKLIIYKVLCDIISIIYNLWRGSMIIDGHAHACGVYGTEESILKYLDDHKIDKVILCAGEPNSSKNYNYPMMSNIFKNDKLGYLINKIISVVVKFSGAAKYVDEQNEYIYELSKKNPEKIINSYWADPLDENVIDKLKKNFSKYDYKLIKMHQCWNKFDMSDKKVREIIEWSIIKKIPIFIHLRSYKQVIKFIEIANYYKEAVFIVAHMIGFRDISRMCQNKNIYYDISAPQLYSVDLLKDALNIVGSKRLILGSDSPYGVDNIEKNIARLKKIGVISEDMDNILYKNIMAIIKI